MSDDAAAASAIAASRLALSVQLRLFAPFLPFVTEEVWSTWQSGSIHVAAWPTTTEIDGASTGSTDGRLYLSTSEILAALRFARSAKKLPFSTPIKVVSLSMTDSQLAQWTTIRQDVLACCNIGEFTDAVLKVDAAAQLAADVEPVA